MLSSVLLWLSEQADVISRGNEQLPPLIVSTTLHLSLWSELVLYLCFLCYLRSGNTSFLYKTETIGVCDKKPVLLPSLIPNGSPQEPTPPVSNQSSRDGLWPQYMTTRRECLFYREQIMQPTLYLIFTLRCIFKMVLCDPSRDPLSI